MGRYGYFLKQHNNNVLSYVFCGCVQTTHADTVSFTDFLLNEKNEKMDVIIFYLLWRICLYLCKVEYKHQNLVIIFGQKVIRVVKLQEDSLNSKIT